MVNRFIHLHTQIRVLFYVDYDEQFIVVTVKVGIPEFLNGIGNGVETYAEKLESEFGDLQNLLVARSLKLKKLNVGGDPKVCKHVSKSTCNLMIWNLFNFIILIGMR